MLLREVSKKIIWRFVVWVEELTIIVIVVVFYFRWTTDNVGGGLSTDAWRRYDMGGVIDYLSVDGRQTTIWYGRCNWLFVCRRTPDDNMIWDVKLTIWLSTDDWQRCGWWSRLFDCRRTTDNGVGGEVDYLTVDGRLTTVWVVKLTIWLSTDDWQRCGWWSWLFDCRRTTDPRPQYRGWAALKYTIPHNCTRQNTTHSLLYCALKKVWRDAVHCNLFLQTDQMNKQKCTYFFYIFSCDDRIKIRWGDSEVQTQNVKWPWRETTTNAFTFVLVWSPSGAYL